MANLILPTVRTTQPQQAVGIDWSNPLAKGLSLLWSAGKGRILNTDFGPQAEDIGASAAVISIMRLGRAATFQNSTSYRWGYPSSTKFEASKTTIFAIAKVRSVTGNNALICKFGDGSLNDSWILRLDGAIPKFYINTSATWVGASGPTISLNGTYVFIGTYDSSTRKINCYVNGVKGTEALSTSAVATSSTSKIRIGSPGVAVAGELLTGDIASFGIIQRALSPLEIKSLSDNPWQIFAPQRKPRYYSTSTTADITVAITGLSATATTGLLAKDIQTALGGLPFSGVLGAITATVGGTAITLNLSGALLTGSKGTLLPVFDKALAGILGTYATTAPIPNTNKALTGISLSSAQGTIASALNKALTGILLTGNQGTITASVGGSSVSVTLSGTLLTGSQTTLVATLSKTLTSLLLAGVQGTITATAGGANITLSLTGASTATLATGTLTKDRSSTLAGSLETLATGSFTPALLTALTQGQILNATRGSVVAEILPTLVGLSGDSAQGAMSKSSVLALHGSNLASALGFTSFINDATLAHIRWIVYQSK